MTEVEIRANVADDAPLQQALRNLGYTEEPVFSNWTL